MTKVFDDKARKELVKNYNPQEFKYNGIPVREMTVKPMTVKEARPYIATFHYSKTMPDSTKYVFGGYLGDTLCGIVTYGMGTGKNQYLSVIPIIENGQYLELTRLWCANEMPKNTESKLISTSLKMLPPEIKLVISFADDSKNHAGTIYQATNWYYLGSNKGGKTLICEDGVIKHTRLIGMYKKRHPELKKLTNNEIMKKYGWTYGEAGSKHRYVQIRGTKKEKKEMYKFFQDKIEDYPKIKKIKSFEVSEDEIIEMEKMRMKPMEEMPNKDCEQMDIFSYI